MNLFKPEFLIQHLRILSDCTDDVKTLALFVNTNKSNSQIILEILNNEFVKSNCKHKIIILELANEILLQNMCDDTQKKNYDSNLTNNHPKNTQNTVSSLAIGIKNYIPVWYAILYDTTNNNIKLNEMKKNWLERKVFEDKDFDVKRKKTENQYTKENMLNMVDKYYNDKKRLKKYFEEYLKDEK